VSPDAKSQSWFRILLYIRAKSPHVAETNAPVCFHPTALIAYGYDACSQPPLVVHNDTGKPLRLREVREHVTSAESVAAATLDVPADSLPLDLDWSALARYNEERLWGAKDTEGWEQDDDNDDNETWTAEEDVDLNAPPPPVSRLQIGAPRRFGFLSPSTSTAEVAECMDWCEPFDPVHGGAAPIALQWPGREGIRAIHPLLVEC